MADETQRIFNLLQNSTKAIANYDVWKYFLKTAAWHFKYPFNDQVLIFDFTLFAQFIRVLLCFRKRIIRTIIKVIKKTRLIARVHTTDRIA